MTKFVQSFANDESGATAIEYALIASIMAAAIVAGMSYLTTGLGDAFAKVTTALS